MNKQAQHLHFEAEGELTTLKEESKKLTSTHLQFAFHVPHGRRKEEISMQ